MSSSGQTEATLVPPIGSLYEAAGRRLMLHRSGGDAGPAVVFLPGAGLVGLDFLNIHERVAELTTSVLYDRAGTGWSDPAPLPRTAAEVADELRELLRAADVPGPYLLAGHSLGGAYARHYAQRFPGEVAGLLLLDPFHEDMISQAPQEVRNILTRMEEEPPEPTADQIQQSRALVERFFAGWPQSVREPLIDYHLAAWRTGLLEGRNLYDDVAAELRVAPAIPHVPLIVLTALGPDATQAQIWPDHLLRAINEGKRALHAELAASVPGGEQRVLDDAGHGWIHEERPDAVLRAITDLIRRSGG